MITGIVKSEKSSRNSISVFWTIGTIGPRVELEEDGKLESVPFYFAGQMWQLLIYPDILEYLQISRITDPRDENYFPVVCWNMGIVDKTNMTHYGRTGFERLSMASEWVTVADYDGPLFPDLCTQKDLYMQDDKITIVLRLILESSDVLIKVIHDPTPMLEQSDIISNIVAINVKDKTFYAENSILDGFTDDVELKTSECITGRMTVIDLPDCHPVAFEFFLSFKDSGEVEGLTDDMAREVYEIADKFQVPEKKRECVQLFLRTLNVSSVCGFLEMAERYDDQELKEGCSDFFMENAREILHTSEWLKFLKARAGDLAGDLLTRFLKSLTERTNVDLMNAANGLIRLRKSKKPR